MEEKESKFVNNKLVIITPKELAELGIYDNLFNIKFNKTEDQKFAATTSTSSSKLNPIKTLKKAIEKKIVLNDKSVFKKPVEPGTSKLKKIQTETKKPVKSSREKNNTDKNKSDIANKSVTNKNVNVINNTPIYLNKEDLNQIINIFPAAETPTDKIIDKNNSLINNSKKLIVSRKNKHIPNLDGRKNRQSTTVVKDTSSEKETVDTVISRLLKTSTEYKDEDKDKEGMGFLDKNNTTETTIFDETLDKSIQNKEKIISNIIKKCVKKLGSNSSCEKQANTTSSKNSINDVEVKEKFLVGLDTGGLKYNEETVKASKTPKSENTFKVPIKDINNKVQELKYSNETTTFKDKENVLKEDENSTPSVQVQQDHEHKDEITTSGSVVKHNKLENIKDTAQKSLKKVSRSKKHCTQVSEDLSKVEPEKTVTSNTSERLESDAVMNEKCTAIQLEEIIENKTTTSKEKYTDMNKPLDIHFAVKLVNEEEDIAAATSVISCNNENKTDMLSTKKKRGRKPKSECQSSPVQTKFEQKIELSMETSRSGRKRLKINYLEIEGMLNNDIQMNKQRKLNYTENEELVKAGNETLKYVEDNQDIKSTIPEKKMGRIPKPVQKEKLIEVRRRDSSYTKLELETNRERNEASSESLKLVELEDKYVDTECVKPTTSVEKRDSNLKHEETIEEKRIDTSHITPEVEANLSNWVDANKEESDENNTYPGLSDQSEDYEGLKSTETTISDSKEKIISNIDKKCLEVCSNSSCEEQVDITPSENSNTEVEVKEKFLVALDTGVLKYNEEKVKIPKHFKISKEASKTPKTEKVQQELNYSKETTTFNKEHSTQVTEDMSILEQEKTETSITVERVESNAVMNENCTVTPLIEEIIENKTITSKEKDTDMNKPLDIHFAVKLVNEEEDIAAATSVVSCNNENKTEILSTKKKRGRKPKSECESSPVQRKIELPMETSKSGRKRLKINYLEIEGILNKDVQMSKRRKLNYTVNEELVKAGNETLKYVEEKQDIKSTIPAKKRGRRPKAIQKKNLIEDSIIDSSYTKLELQTNREKNEPSSKSLKLVELEDKYVDTECVKPTTSGEKRDRKLKSEQTIENERTDSSHVTPEVEANLSNWVDKNKKKSDENNKFPELSDQSADHGGVKSTSPGKKIRSRKPNEEEKFNEERRIDTDETINDTLTFAGLNNKFDEGVKTPTPRKKRGRKPKIKQEEELNDTRNEESSHEKQFNEDNSISNLSDSKDTKVQESTPNNVNITISKPMSKRGRKKKIPDNSQYATLDDDNNVICVVCNIKVKIGEWKNHNKIVHNNLGWSQGEPELRLDDTVLLKNILQPLLTENKLLVCFKCKNGYKKIKEFILHKEECEGIVNNGKVTCAVCNDLIARELWRKHKLKHNNLAWRIGDPPMNVNDENVVTPILLALYKAKKPLHCERCKEVKKSVLGFLSHRYQCGLDSEAAKIPCEVCGKKCLPSSMPSHLKQHYLNKEEESEKRKSDYFDVDPYTPLTKRKAASKALTILDQISKGDKLEHFRFYVKQMKFDENDEFIAFLRKELQENKLLKCRISGCEFSAQAVPVLLEHMNKCPLTPTEHYSCNNCYTVCSSEEAVIQHLETVHDRKVNLDDDYEQQNQSSDGEDEIEEVETELDNKKNRKSTVIVKRNREDKQTPLFVLSTSRKNIKKLSLYSHAFKFTFEFCRMHFTATNLFENLYSHGLDLFEEDIEQYLPPNDVSCDVSRKIVHGFENVHSTDYELKKFELFEVEKNDSSVTIFCGGPIRSMAWLPTPYTSLNELQILAVGIGHNFDGIYYFDENYAERTLIQFWNFGVLKNRLDIETPTFEFGLVFDNGPIWHMEWCPHGCFNPENTNGVTRMGLLAVAGSMMPVNIYSIPFLEEKEKGLFYKLNPVLKLQLVHKQSELKRNIFATKISWSKVSGCTSVAVGYSDGNVAIYNIKITSNLSRFKDNTTEVLLPQKIIKAHTHFISVVSWVPIDGDRLLMTSSYDKNTFIWDLYTEDKFAAKTKKIFTDGTWLNNWLSFVTVYEEATLTNGSVMLTHYNFREYLDDNFTLSKSLGTILTLSSSDWLNGFVHANTVGEIVASFPHQMLFCQDLINRGLPFRCLLGYTKLIDKTKSPEERAALDKKKRLFLKPVPRTNSSCTLKDFMKGKDPYDIYEPINYRESIDQYGVLFCDVKPGHVHAWKWISEQSEYSKPNLYPLQDINKISFNPNRQASLYYAAGYQIGFIRLGYMKSLEQDPQIDAAEKIYDTETSQ